MADRLIEEIRVDNRTIKVVHDQVPIELVELDFENPRIKYRLALEIAKQGKRPNERELEKIILSLNEVKDLRRDIKANGGIHERVILQENGEKFKAVEGNVRSTCYRSLHAELPKDNRFKTIPARILPSDVDPRIVAKLLTTYHVAGKIQWRPHEKAGHCYHMAHTLGMKQEDIASAMRTSKGTVNRYLTAYSFFTDTFLTIDNKKYAEAGNGKWSYFEEFFKKKEFRDELNRNPKFGEDFCRWVGEGRLPQGSDVRRLPLILKHSAARAAFEDGEDFEEVIKIVEKEDPEAGSDFFKLLAKMRESCTTAAQVKEILRIRTDAVARQKLLDTYEAMVDFMRLADVEVPSANNEEGSNGNLRSHFIRVSRRKTQK